MLGQWIAVVMQRFESGLAVWLFVGKAPICSARYLRDADSFLRRAAHGNPSVTELKIVKIRFE